VVTGATGRTGALVYGMLKDAGVNVRGLVRNVTKAREVLKCGRCGESEGIFVGDVSQKGALSAVMAGATGLAIATSAAPHCENLWDPRTCSYPAGQYPVDVDFNGGRNQIEAFAAASGGAPGPVVLCSMMGTTQPDPLSTGRMGFFKLNEEAFLMSSGVPYTIVKPCGLSNDGAFKRELRVGRDDEMHESPPMIPRADVARVMAAALLQPKEAAGLRFDLCSRAGAPTTDLASVFDAARYPWQKPSHRVMI